LEGSERQTYNMQGYDGVHYSGNVAFISEWSSSLMASLWNKEYTRNQERTHLIYVQYSGNVAFICIAMYVSHVRGLSCTW
jgi:hypothetical protein